MSPFGGGAGGGWKAKTTMSTPGLLKQATPASGGQYRHTGLRRYDDIGGYVGLRKTSRCGLFIDVFSMPVTP